MHKQWMLLESSSVWLIGLANHNSDADLVKELSHVRPELLTPVITHVNKDGRTLLHATAVRERLEALGFLLKNTVDVDTRDGEGVSPLYTCITHNALSAAQMLVRSGADVNETVCRLTRETMLHRMVKAGRIKPVEFLLEYGAATDAGTSDGNTALHFAARYDRSNMAAMLLDGGCDINATNESGETALHVAITSNHMELAKLLIRRRANVNIKDRLGMTALHVAVGAGSIDLARTMLSANSSHINSKEQLLGRTPLLLACSNGTQKMASLLLAHGADANLTTNYRKSVLHVAASHGNTGVLGAVIKCTSNLNALAINNMTALHYAVCGGYTDIVKILLQAGISANMKDIHGMSPLHMASADGNGDIVSTLLQYDVQINATNMEQQTALHTALIKGHEEIGSMLMAAGCDGDLLDVHDKKALDYLLAFREKQSEQMNINSIDCDKLSTSHEEKRLHVHFSAMNDGEEEIIEDYERSGNEISNMLNVGIEYDSTYLESTTDSKGLENMDINETDESADDLKLKNIIHPGIEGDFVNGLEKLEVKDEIKIEEDKSFHFGIEDTSEFADNKQRKQKHKNSTHSKSNKSSKERKVSSAKKHSKSKTKSHHHPASKEVGGKCDEHDCEKHERESHKCQRKHKVQN